MRCYGATDERGMLGTGHQPMERPMPKPNDLSRSLIAFEQNSTLIAVIEMSLSSWGVKGRAVSIPVDRERREWAARRRPAKPSSWIAPSLFLCGAPLVVLNGIPRYP